jgi:Virulence factor membrane-bound polymerase, C-terminal
LTPFPHRPVAFFDHTHNLPLQFMVELGVPIGLLVLGLLMIALIDVFRSCTRPDEDARVLSMTRAGLAIVLLIAVHSLLEYPLWYSYFLLPAAFVFGFCSSGSGATLSGAAQTVQATAPHKLSVVWLSAGVLLVVGGLAAVIDYKTVAAIFSSGSNMPLAERIRQGQRSWFFAHHADYAAATTVDHPSTAMPSFKVATHNLLDTRLMIAWAKAYAEQGDLDRARYIAMRLKEFRNEDAEEFFEPCSARDRLEEPVPFQCEAPQHPLSYRDFR